VREKGKIWVEEGQGRAGQGRIVGGEEGQGRGRGGRAGQGRAGSRETRSGRAGLKERRRGCVGGEGEGEEGQIKQDRTGNPEKFSFPVFLLWCW
jgi:hypothetical protein